MSIERARSCFWFSAGLCFWPALVLILRWLAQGRAESRQPSALPFRPTEPTFERQAATARRAASSRRQDRSRRPIPETDSLQPTACELAGGYSLFAGQAFAGHRSAPSSPSSPASPGAPIKPRIYTAPPAASVSGLPSGRMAGVPMDGCLTRSSPDSASDTWSDASTTPRVDGAPGIPFRLRDGRRRGKATGGAHVRTVPKNWKRMTIDASGR